MPNMKLILERWDSYLIFEEDTISKLKTDPTSVEELADDVTSIKDRKRLQAVLNALVADPQVPCLPRNHLRTLKRVYRMTSLTYQPRHISA